MTMNMVRNNGASFSSVCNKKIKRSYNSLGKNAISPNIGQMEYPFYLHVNIHGMAIYVYARPKPPSIKCAPK